jgi:hypothetical protein
VNFKDMQFYVGELRSEECQCGQWKKPGYSLCYRCYKALPRDMRNDLYKLVGRGYEAAYDAALKYLND